VNVDAMGLKCPMPIVRLGKAVKEAALGETITVVADDAPFPSDLRAWCKMTGHTLVSLTETDPKRFVAVIKKAK
jgi:tRNA 2-thiouridine synthesizing protein A